MDELAINKEGRIAKGPENATENVFTRPITIFCKIRAWRREK